MVPTNLVRYQPISLAALSKNLPSDLTPLLTYTPHTHTLPRNKLRTGSHPRRIASGRTVTVVALSYSLRPLSYSPIGVTGKKASWYGAFGCVNPTTVALFFSGFSLVLNKH